MRHPQRVKISDEFGIELLRRIDDRRWTGSVWDFADRWSRAAIGRRRRRSPVASRCQNFGQQFVPLVKTGDDERAGITLTTDPIGLQTVIAAGRNEDQSVGRRFRRTVGSVPAGERSGLSQQPRMPCNGEGIEDSLGRLFA